MPTEQEILEANRVFHSFQADDYDETHDIDPIERLLLQDTTNGVAEEDILDIASGTCAVAKFLDKDVVSTDLSPEMLSNGRGPRIVASASTLPFESDTFELVTMRSALHHVPNLNDTILEIKRVLKPSGTVLFLHEPATGRSKITDFAARTRAFLWKALGRTREGWREEAAKKAGVTTSHELTRLVNHGTVNGIPHKNLSSQFEEEIYVEYPKGRSLLFSFRGKF